MSGAIVTIAQIAAASAAAAAITATDAGWTSTSCTGAAERVARTLPGLRAHRRYGTAGCPARRGPWSGGRTASPARRRSPIVGTIVGLVVLKQVFVAAHRPISWAVAAVAAAGAARPDRGPPGRAHPPGPGRAAHLPRHRRHRGRAPPTSCSTRSSRRSTGSRRRPRRRPTPSRTATTGSASWRATSSSARASTTPLDALDERVTGGEDVLVSTAGTAPAYLVCTILTIFLMTFGPRMAGAALEQDPDEERRRRTARVLGPAVSHARTAVLLSALEAIVVGAGGGRGGDRARPARAVGGGLHRRRAVAVPARRAHARVHPAAAPRPRLPIADRRAGARSCSCSPPSSPTRSCSARTSPRRASTSASSSRGSSPCSATAIYGIGGAVFGTIYAVFGLAVLDQLDRENRRRTSLAPLTLAVRRPRGSGRSSSARRAGACARRR